MIQLNREEIRVLASLIEKEKTTPENFPLSLNSLTLACNQKSNRNPVVNFDEGTVENAIDSLREKKLAWECATSGGRVPKYRHQFSEVLPLAEPEVAVLTVLMLRGPQTIGEIKSRCLRLYAFPSLSKVEETLRNLSSREEQKLVKQLPRQVGRKECRYVHLLGGDEEEHYGYGDEFEPKEESGLDSTPPPLVERVLELENTVKDLSREMAELREELTAFKKQFE